MKVFTAFSGYDSQCMALDRLGIDYNLVGWSEIDKYAIQAHNAVYPQYADRNYGDICKIDWIKVPDFDLFTYSFPCQDISNAGLQRGLKEGSGTRSGLLWECRKAIEIKRPKYLLMENVKALTSEKFLPYLQKWLFFLESMGYSNFTKVLNSKDYGVPQNRERVFCVSILGEERYYFPKPFKLEKRLKDVLENNVDESYYLSKKLIDYVFSDGGKNNDIKGGIGVQDGSKITGCITANYWKTPRQGNYLIEKYGYTRVQKLVDSGKINGEKVEFLDAYNQTVSDLSDYKEITSTAKNLKNIADKIRNQDCGITINPDMSLRPYRNDKSKSGISELQTDYDKSLASTLISARPNLLYGKTTDYRIRKLTPRECFRLMGVSEENIDKIQNAGISKTQQYKMAGNSIVVDVLYYIFKKLFIDKKANKGDEQILF